MITVDREQFTRALKLASAVVERRSWMPILQGVKLTANGMLAIEGTDLDTFTRAELPFNGDDGELFLPGPHVVEQVLKAADAPVVEFGASGKRVTMISGALSADLAALDAKEFPVIDRGKTEFECSFGSAQLAAFRRVRAAISTEETRYYLNGVHMHHVEGATYRLAATDGHRLMIADIELPDAKGELPSNLILHRDFVRIALNSFDIPDASLSFVVGIAGGYKRAVLAGAVGDLRFELGGKGIDGSFPDYQRVVPTETPLFVRCRGDDLAKAVGAATALATEKMRAAKFSFGEGSLTCSVDSVDLGKGGFKIAAEHNTAKGFKIAFNARYLLDVITAAAGDEIEVRMIDPAAPAVFTNPADASFTAVLIPMRA